MRSAVVQIWRAAIPLVWLLASAPIVAQDDETIDEIQVTATRRPAPASGVSAALTVITGEDIGRGKLMTDALAARPGVFLQQTTPGQGAVIVRGLKGSEVLHLVDGMRLNNAIFRNAPTQYLALVAPGTLERIEVVRGAPASLYGSDAVGGVVQALSQVPAFDARGTRGKAFVAFDTADLAKIARASFAFGDERLATLVSGEYLDTGSRRTGGGDRLPVDGYQSRGARIALAATPENGQSWLFDLQMARQPESPRVDELIPGFGQVEPSSSEFSFAPNDRVFGHVRHTRDDWLLNADWNFDLGWQRIVDDRITRDFQSDLRRLEDNSSDLFGLTASAGGESAAGSWIAGVEIYHDRVDSRRFEEDLTSGITRQVAARFPDGSTVDQAALYGNILRRVSARHRLSGGLRFSSISADLPETGAVPATAVDQDDLSADIGWIFDISDQTQLTSNLGYGFRAPNVFDLGTLGERPGNRFNVPNPNLESERITHFDVGIRHRGERLDLDLVVFTLHYTDRIASVLTGDVTPDGRDVTQSRNVSSADINGIEFSARYLLSTSLRADVVLNYLRGEQTDAAGVDVPGDRIPPFNGRLSLHYEVSSTLTVEPYLLFAGEQERLSQRDVGDPRIDPNGTPGWMTANLAASWQFGDAWILAASLENLFDKRYRVHGSGVDAVGRNLYLSLQKTW